MATAQPDDRLFFEPVYQNELQHVAILAPGCRISADGNPWPVVVVGSGSSGLARRWLVVRGRQPAAPPLTTLASYARIPWLETSTYSTSLRLQAGGGAGAWDNYQRQ